MLDLFRKQKTASRWILGVITGVMALGMVVFFIPAPTAVSDGVAGDVVAQVGKSEITTVAYVNSLRRFLKNANYPKDIEFLKRFGVPKQLLNDMIIQKLLEIEAERYGLTATDPEVRERILSYPVFAQMAGSFNMQVYSRVLQQTGTTVDEFEESVRREILTTKLHYLITDGVLVDPEDVLDQYRRENEKVKLEYALFDPTEVEKTMKVNEVDLKMYFDLHARDFMTSEQREVKYILVDKKKIRDDIKVTDDDLRQYYEQNRTRYFVSDRNRVSHILFKTPGKSPEEVEKIRQKALEALAKARAGGDFAKLAKEYSEDVASKDKGGDLGWADANTPFVPEFKQVALALGPGGLSDLVTTQFGFHIIKVTDHQSAHTESFDEVKETIRPTYMAQKSDQEGSALAQQIYSTVASKPKEFDAVAKQSGLEVRQVPFFAKGESVPEIGSNPDFEARIFSLQLNQVGAPVHVAPGFAIPLLEHIRPPHTPDLAEIRDKVEIGYKRDKAARLAKSKAEAFAKSVVSAKNFVAAAKSAGLNAEASEPFLRNASEKILGSTSEISPVAFKMSVGDTSGAVKFGTKFIVFRVTEKQEAKPEEFEKAKAELTARLLEQKRNTVFTSFQEDLLERYKKEGKVKINEKALDAALNRRLT